MYDFEVKLVIIIENHYRFDSDNDVKTSLSNYENVDTILSQWVGNIN